MPKLEHPFCRSFKPIVDARSRVLILGSMPGPVALKRQQYYGFPGNHFWTIIPTLLMEPITDVYEEKVAMVRRHGIALWDVLESCTRPGALDSDIRNITPNKIPQLIHRYPGIQAIFVNGQYAHKTFQKKFHGEIDRPVFVLPSTSPANAAMPIKEKIRRWGAIRKFL